MDLFKERALYFACPQSSHTYTMPARNVYGDLQPAKCGGKKDKIFLTVNTNRYSRTNPAHE
ncbi:UNVERIFIED_CONTAM: hypothetical protein FKN15_044799 [Acipenser sinensis]